MEIKQRNDKAWEPGLMVWATGGPQATLRELDGFGLRAGQLGIPPGMDCGADAVAAWQEALRAHPVRFAGAVCAYAGEDYADLDRVHRTVGFTAPGYAAERIARTQEVSAFAAALGLGAVSCHIGFIPADPGTSLYQDLLAIARELCAVCARHGQHFVLETGQESAATLLAFLGDAGQPNLRVNFDPANMILYGSGDPLDALDRLRAHVVSVHCKDGRSPAAPGQLGVECALGDGEVNFPAFLATLRRIGYRGQLTLEREEHDAGRRAADIRLGLSRLQAWQQEAREETTDQ